MPRYFIVAATERGLIGRNNQMPWDIPEESQYFQDAVFEAVVIVMGRKTWDALARKPWSGKMHLILTRSPQEPLENVKYIKTLDEVSAYAHPNDSVWYIGGTSLYNKIDEILPDFVYLTTIRGEFGKEPTDKILSHVFYSGLNRYRLLSVDAKWLVDNRSDKIIECIFMIFYNYK